MTETETIKGYMCGIAFMHEVGEAADGVRVYSSPEGLKKYAKCTDECGIVEVNLTFSRWVEDYKG